MELKPWELVSEVGGGSPMRAALDGMWTRFLPQMRERVELLEAAARELREGRSTAERMAEAAQAAHNLAGVLGSFGLTQGTVLARELERLLAREGGPEAGQAARLQAMAGELRNLVDGRG